MAPTQMKTVLRHLRRAALNGDAVATSDGQLLDRFIHTRDENAFATLVRRHGPMVLGVCRRIAGNPHDADDAFQAAFLVLVRKARSVVPRAMVGNWLHGVAYHTALRARATADRRRGKEKQVTDMPHPETPTKEIDHDLLALLDREVQRLPDKYRLPVVLCELEGRSRKEVAGQLGVPEGTLSSRLAKARKLLAGRLGRHGLALGAGVVTAALAEQAATAAVSNSLMQSTVTVAALTALGRATAGVVSAQITLLTEGVLKTMLLTKLKIAVGTVLVLGLVVCGAAAGWYGSAAAGEPREGNEPPTANAPKADDHRGKNAGTDVEPIFGSGLAKADPLGKTDAELIQGTWQVVWQTQTKHEPPDELKNVWKPGTLTCKFIGTQFLTEYKGEATFVLDPTASPKRMSLKVKKPRETSRLAIYELDGNDLKICMADPDGKEYPQSFDVQKAKPKTFSAMVLKRVDHPEKKKTDATVRDYDAAYAELQAAELKALLNDNQARMDKAEAQKQLVEIQLKQLTADRNRLEFQRRELEAKLAQMKAQIDATNTPKKATKGQPNDNILQRLDEIEKLIRQMRKELQDKKDQKE